MNLLTKCLAALICAGLLPLAVAQEAADYPSRPVRVVLPYPPGNLPDTVARLVGEQLGKALRTSVVVEARPGAGGIVAAEAVARAAPDGYTVLWADVQIWAIDKLLYKNLSFDAERDFVPVSLVAETPLLMVVGQPFPTAPEWPAMAAHIKTRPATYRYASNGMGSVAHFAMAAINAKAGLDIQHIPYKGAPEFLPALKAGDVNLVITSPAGLPAAQGMGARAVAATTAKRIPSLPQLPTFQELGLDGVDFSGAFGALAPRGTPKAVVDKLAAALRQAVQEPEVARKLGDMGVLAVGSSPDALAAWIRQDIAKYAEANKWARVEPQ